MNCGYQNQNWKYDKKTNKSCNFYDLQKYERKINKYVEIKTGF